MTDASAPLARRPGPAPSERTRERILRLADALFAKHGYAGVPMSEVAGAAGVTKPAVYYHFRDKDALFVEVVTATTQRVGGLVAEAAASDAPLEQRIASVVHVLLTGSQHHPVRLQADISEHLSEELQRRLDDTFRRGVMAPIAAMFEDASQDGGLREDLTPATSAAALVGLSMAFLPPARLPADADLARPQREAEAPATVEPDRASAVVASVLMHGVALAE